MRRTLMVAGLVAALAAPSVTDARTYCQQRAHDRKVVGTLVGAGVGALVGNAVSHRNGALIGGVGGAVVGNQVSRVKCDDRRVHYRSRAVVRRPAYAPRYDSASYRGAPGACHYENRPYYDERGQMIYAPTQVCR